MKFGSTLSDVISVIYVCCAMFVAQFAQGSPDSLARDFGGAMDAKGERHCGTDYASNRVPWIPDYAVSPITLMKLDGPCRGEGFFRVILDLKTGLVRNAIVVRSTGDIQIVLM